MPNRFSAAVVLALVTAALPLAAAEPTPQVAFDSALFVEHSGLSHGVAAHTLVPATQLARGDRVVTLLTWYRLSGRGGFVVTDPLPARLVWQGSADSQEEVSVDGGRTWGRLGMLRLGNGRLATGADVTHVRWHVGPGLAENGSGTITYAGVVK